MTNFEGEVTLTLTSPITDEMLSDLRDDELENTSAIVVTTPKGKEVQFRKVVFAHWVEKGGNLIECSNCKQEMNCLAGFYTWLSFCPKCGATIERGLRK